MAKKNKNRSFSIYLLKPSFDASNALEDDHGLEAENAAHLPAGASLFVLDRQPTTPWWRGYFGITKDLKQVSKGALVFLPVQGRCFALSFGHVYHHLKDTSYEYDFGLRVTLNALDPNRLISTDTLEPSAALKQRTQVPKESDLTYFDFDRESSIIKSLTGKVRAEYKDLVRHVTGSSSLRISSDMQPADLVATCEKLFKLYESEDYKINFPNLQNIVPVKDPVIIDALNAKVLQAFHDKDIDLCLVVPDIVNYHDNVYSLFTGGGSGLRYEDVDMQNYYEYLQGCNIDYKTVDLDILKKHKLALADEDGNAKDSYNLYRSLVFDADLNGGSETYHLCEGNWYKVENDYMEKLKSYLDPCYEDQSLIPYTHETESDYNKAVATADNNFICLDTKSMAPSGQTAIEPCDLYTVSGGTAILYHVKVSTRSSQLSHLFGQGLNSIELLVSEPEAKEKIKGVIKAKINGQDETSFLAPIDNGPYKIVYAIVTKKDKAKKSLNLPLFSRISLMRSLKALRQMKGVDTAVYCFVDDQVAKKSGQPKPKKPRKKKAAQKPVTGVSVNIPTDAANVNQDQNTGVEGQKKSAP